VLSTERWGKNKGWVSDQECPEKTNGYRPDIKHFESDIKTRRKKLIAIT